MFKDKEAQKEANRLASQRRRDKGMTHRGYTEDEVRLKGMTQGMTKTGYDGEGMTQYPAIVHAVTDPIKRDKLTRIYNELNRRKLAGEVRYGIYGPSFDVVGQILEVT